MSESNVLLRGRMNVKVSEPVFDIRDETAHLTLRRCSPPSASHSPRPPTQCCGAADFPLPPGCKRRQLGEAGSRFAAQAPVC